jgi:hypothetical protein
LIVPDAVRTRWDADRFSEKVKNIKVKTSGEPPAEETLDKFFEQASFGDLEEPVTIIDAHGKVLAWSLPGVLHENRLV